MLYHGALQLCLLANAPCQIITCGFPPDFCEFQEWRDEDWNEQCGAVVDLLFFLKLKRIISALLAANSPAANLTSVTVWLVRECFDSTTERNKKRQGQKDTKTQRKVNVYPNKMPC